ncbi:MAG: NAD(P)H-dependent oxidoreductase subunit E [Thermodesulfobacteriota bacterium]|nr:NAD(P)H-dependent oxidoreductase subunit E [Thermodesulfobacteriota bacterium]
MAIDIQKIDQIISTYERTEESLLAILQDFQHNFNYVPEEGIRRLSEIFGVSESRLYAMGTFYNALSLVPRGRHTIKVCSGTTCHLKGAGLILEAFERELGVKRGGVTEDMRFSIETVNCVGACAMAPVVMVDDDYHGHVTPSNITGVLKKYD